MTTSTSPRPRTLAADDFVYELDGGALCLDFVNTFSASGEHLHAYSDLVAFAYQSGLLSREDAMWLRQEGQRDPGPAEGVLRRALQLRAAMRNIFGALAAGKRPPEADLAYLNFDLAVSLSHARVIKTGDAYRWGWSGRNLDAVLWPVSRSAADLLTSDTERHLVRECGASDCQWLFLDASKNRSRQWCSMQSCGNREKARRHYQRVRGTRGRPPGGTAEASLNGGEHVRQRRSEGRAGRRSART
jgi:predicted RNA-binding Zn ribbon-like protein